MSHLVVSSIATLHTIINLILIQPLSASNSVSRNLALFGILIDSYFSKL